MTRNRYKEWITVFEWFQQTNIKQVVPRENWDALWVLLNSMWQEERKNATPEELAAHAGAINNLKQ